MGKHIYLFRSFVVIFLFSLFNLGCKPLQENRRSVSNTVFSADSISLRCEEASCPENVAMVLTNEGVNAFGRCTGSLVDLGGGESAVLTNAHCLPESLRKAGAKCSELIKVHFVSKNDPNKSEGFACKEILFSTKVPPQGEGSMMDYAFLSLEKDPNRKAYSVSKKPWSDFTKTTAWSINDDNKDGKYSIHRYDCEVNWEGYPFMTTKATSGLPAYIMTGCDLHPGNSGSGVLNKNGELLGVFSHYWKRISGEWGIDSFDFLSLNSNVKCMCLPKNSRTPVTSCQVAQSCLDNDKEVDFGYQKENLFLLQEKYLATTQARNLTQTVQQEILGSVGPNEVAFKIDPETAKIRWKDGFLPLNHRRGLFGQVPECIINPNGQSRYEFSTKGAVALVVFYYSRKLRLNSSYWLWNPGDKWLIEKEASEGMYSIRFTPHNYQQVVGENIKIPKC